MDLKSYHHSGDLSENKITENNTKSDEGLGNKYFSNLREIKLSELPGTETEVSSIEKYLNTKKWDVKKYIKSDATKFAVKTANSPRVLHIATHGLPWDARRSL